MSPLQRASAALLVALIFAACAAPAPRPAPVTDEEQQAYDAAIAELETAPGAAEIALEDFARANPRSGLADDAALLLAERARQAGQVDEALEWLYFALREQPQGERAGEARLSIAELELERGDLEAARRAIGRLSEADVAEPDRVRVARVRADLAETPPERLRWLSILRATWLTTGGDGARVMEAVDDIDREIDSTLTGMSVDELDRALDLLRGRTPAALVHLRLAELALEAGELDDAERQLERARRLPVSPSEQALLADAARHLELRRQLEAEGDILPSFAAVAALPLPSTAAARGVIGVALPLTGPFADYGEATLRGILLAARIFDETGRVRELQDGGAPGAGSESASTEPGTAPSAIGARALPRRGRVRILVRDTAGTPERAAAAVRELAAEPELSAIIGPLLSGESEAAARAAQELGVPLLTLSSREPVAGRGESVFRLGAAPLDEVRTVVEYSVRELASRRFAVLYPRDGYGRGMREHFWKEVEARGLHVVAVAAYDPDDTDFAEPIRSLIGYSLLTDAERKALAEREEVLRRARRLPPEEAGIVREEAYAQLGPEGEPLPPRVDFDALFVPDGHEKVVLIAPQLAFHEVNGVNLLGTAAWDDPELVRIGRDHLRGAVYATPFYAESRFVHVSRFVERYSTVFGATPDRFAAQAYDAAVLTLVQLAQGRDTWSELRDGLLATRGFPGVSGVTTILPDGNARKRPYLIGVRGSRLVPLD